AFLFAENVNGADIQYCQEHACKDPDNAYTFAKNIPGADIKYCQEHACKNPKNASFFAKNIPGADIDLLQDYFYIDYASALNVINIPNVNVNKLIESIINYDYEKNIS